MKLIGLKKAVGDYKKLNAGGYYSPHYGYIMFDKSSGKLWTDEFYDLGHNSWINYNDKNIINLGAIMSREEIGVNMQNVKKYIAENF